MASYNVPHRVSRIKVIMSNGLLGEITEARGGEQNREKGPTSTWPPPLTPYNPPDSFISARDGFLSRISALLHTQSGFRFPGDDFRLLLGPVVYIMLWQGNPLYIGMSKRGISRLTAGRHRQAEDERRECDEVWVFPAASVQAARELEHTLILALNPPQNQNGRNGILNKLLGTARFRMAKR